GRGGTRDITLARGQIHSCGGRCASSRVDSVSAMTTTSSASSALVQPIAQYSIRRILAIWGAATLPMAAGAWVVAPWLASKWTDGNGLLRGILLSLTCALIWQFLVVAFLVYREQGTLRWSVVREALWLQVPYSQRRQARSR